MASKVETENLAEHQNSQTFVWEIQFFDASLSINQAYIGDVGCAVWDAALVVAKYFKKALGNDLDGRKVLEFGTDTGIVRLCGSVAG